MRRLLFVVILSGSSGLAWAEGADFGTHLHAKFQVKACTVCHDFFAKERRGLAFNTHEGRTPEMCVMCHSREVTGFEHEEEWFARPELYTSSMTARQACEAIKKAMHAEFKSPALLAWDLEKHLFEDPRVLWGIEGATPNSGMLPEDKRQADLVKGGLAQWKEQVRAWISAGMECGRSEPPIRPSKGGARKK